MRNPSQALGHAQAAVDRAASIAAHFRSEAVRRPGLSRQRRLMLEYVARDLDKRRASLADKYTRMSACSTRDLPANWKSFFDCYDAFLGVAARYRLEEIEAEEPAAPQAVGTVQEANPKP